MARQTYHKQSLVWELNICTYEYLWFGSHGLIFSGAVLAAITHASAPVWMHTFLLMYRSRHTGMNTMTVCDIVTLTGLHRTVSLSPVSSPFTLFSLSLCLSLPLLSLFNPSFTPSDPPLLVKLNHKGQWRQTKPNPQNIDCRCHGDRFQLIALTFHSGGSRKKVWNATLI